MAYSDEIKKLRSELILSQIELSKLLSLINLCKTNKTNSIVNLKDHVLKKYNINLGDNYGW